MTDFQPEARCEPVTQRPAKPNKAERFFVAVEADIMAFLTKRQMTESRFGRECANNTELLPRLRRRQISGRTLMDIYDYLRDHRK